MNSAVLSAVRITEIPVCIVEGDKSGANYSYTSRVENYGFLSYWCHRCILAAHRRRCRLERLSVRLPLRDLPCSVTPPPPPNPYFQPSWSGVDDNFNNEIHPFVRRYGGNIAKESQKGSSREGVEDKWNARWKLQKCPLSAPCELHFARSLESSGKISKRTLANPFI